MFSDIPYERKTIPDFVNSMSDGRLWDQIRNMKEAYPRAIYMIEGNPADIPLMRKLQGALPRFWSCISAITLGWKMPVLIVPNLSHLAMLVSYMYVKENRHEPFMKPVERKGDTLPERMENMVAASGEGIGRVKAQAILTHYGSIGNFVETLPRFPTPIIKGIGPKNLETMLEALTTDYSKAIENEKAKKKKS